MTAKIKLNAASGGGSISLKAPSTTTSNAAVELQLPVADGSSGQFMKTDGSGNLAFATVTDTNDYVKLQSVTGADLGGGLNIDSLDTSTYRAFEMYFAFLPDSSGDGQYPYMRFRTTAGADEEGTHYSFAYNFNYQDDGISYIARINNNKAGLTHTVGSQAAVEGMTGVIRVMLNRSGDSFNAGSGGSAAWWQIIHHNEVENMRSTVGSCVFNNSSAVNHAGFTFFLGAGGFDNYKYSLYGLKG